MKINSTNVSKIVLIYHKFRYNHHLTNDDLDLEVKKIVSKDSDVLGISIRHTTFNSIKLMKSIKKQIPDFDKKKKGYKYEDFFREALRGTKNVAANRW